MEPEDFHKKFNHPRTIRALPISIGRENKFTPKAREITLINAGIYNVKLAVKCLDSLYTPDEEWHEHCRLLIEQEAQRQIQTPKDQAEMTRAFFALMQLERWAIIQTTFADIGKPQKFHHQFIQKMMQTLELTQMHQFLCLLFNNCQAKLRYQKTSFKQLAAHQLWLTALQYIPDNWEVGKTERADLLAIYRFFVEQRDYSATLDLLPEKLVELEADFKSLLREYYDGLWLRRVYEEWIKHHPQKMKVYLAEMYQEGITLDEISYSTLINKSRDSKQAFELFEEMKQAGLKIDEYSYNTLINKSRDSKQAFELFEDMKQAGLKIDVITFTTLLKKAAQDNQPLPIILNLLDEMILLKIKPSVGGINKKGKREKPYTVYAVQKKLHKSQKPYQKWVTEKRAQLQNEPYWLQDAWEAFFQQTTK